MINKKFEELKHTGNLPSPSGIGLSILRLTQSSEHTLEELTKCIQADPALTGRLLRLANGARPSGDPVTTVGQAAERLGLRSVRNVALGFTLASAQRSSTALAFDHERYWSRSLACAVGAHTLAERTQSVDPAEAFTCGLMSRVGMLALASVHADTYGGLVARAANTSLTELLAAETRAYEIHHIEITSAMLAEWGLPSRVPAAIEMWASPSDSESDDASTRSMALVLEVGSKVADLLLSNWDHDSEEYAAAWVPLRESARRLGIDEERLFSACAAIAREWQEWGEVFRIPTRANSGFVDGVDPAPAESSLVRLRALRGTSPDGARAADALDEPKEPPRAPIRVLVVEDDQRLLRLVALHLERAGYHVTTAENGRRGLELALGDAPDIVVSDWAMPELSGLDLCKRLRSVQSGHRTYVVLLTAREEEDRIVDAFDAGVDDYVAKPFNARILLARVQAGHRMIELQRRVEADKVLRSKQVSELGLLTRRLRAAALTDVLTELPNRRFAVNRLVQEWDAALRMSRPLSVVLLDIDHFKQVNDRYGHAVGDKVLQATAEVLRKKTRRSDIVCRWGGEEFLVINVNSDVEGALRCAERLRKSIEANEILCEGYRGFVTASLGVAQKSSSTSSVDGLIKLADQAVYEAKNTGRNRIRCSPPLGSGDSSPDGIARSA